MTKKLSPQAERSLARWFPPAGPCAFCGFHDKRHRLWDAICDLHRAGESAKNITRWYAAYPLEAVQAVLRLQPYQPKPRKKNPR